MSIVQRRMFVCDKYTIDNNTGVGRSQKIRDILHFQQF